MVEYNTGNAVHYGLLAVKMLKAADHDKYEKLSFKFNVFSQCRILHPKRLIEQSLTHIEKILDEVSVFVEIDASVTITIWHLRCQNYKPSAAVEKTIVFDKTRCWQLAVDSTDILKPSDPECYKLQMSSEQKVKGFLRYFGRGLNAQMLYIGE